MPGTDRPESSGPSSKESPSGRTASVSHLPPARPRSTAEFDPSDAFFPANLPDMDDPAARATPRAAPARAAAPASAASASAAPAPRAAARAYVEAPPTWQQENAAKIVASVAVLSLAVGAYFYLRGDERVDARPAAATPAVSTGQIQRPAASRSPATATAPSPGTAPAAAPALPVEAPKPQPLAIPPKATPPVATVTASPRSSPASRAAAREAAREAAPVTPGVVSTVTHTRGQAAAAPAEPVPASREPPAAAIAAPARRPAETPAEARPCTPAVAALGLCTP